MGEISILYQTSSLQRTQTEAKLLQTQVSSLQRTPAKPRFAAAKESSLQRINQFNSQVYSLHSLLQRTIRYSERKFAAANSAKSAKMQNAFGVPKSQNLTCNHS